MNGKRILLLMIAGAVFLLNACDGDLATQKTSSTTSGLQKTAVKAMNYTETTTREFEDGITPYRLNIQTSVESRVVDGISRKQSKIVRNVTINPDGTMSVTPIGSDTSLGFLFPSMNRKELLYDGSMITVKDFNGNTVKQELTLSDKSELTKKFHDHVGGGAKAKAVKDFFNDISLHPNDVLKKAKKVFKNAEQIDEKYLRFTDDMFDGTHEFIFDIDQKVISGQKTIKEGNVLSESSFEYQTIEGSTIRTKTTRSNYVSRPDGKVAKIKITREMSNIHFN